MQLKKNLNSSELVAYRARGKGMQIRFYDEQQISLATDVFFQKVMAITGISLGQGKLFENISDEIFAFIVSVPAFNRLTFEEIITAFRMNAAGTLNGERVEHYNAPLNCDYVGKVLEKYVVIRQSIENKELYAFPVQSKQIEYVPEYDEEKLIDQCKMIYFNTKKVGLITDKVYDILEKKGMLQLTTDQKNKIKSKVIGRMENEALAGGLQAMRNLEFLKSDRTKYEISVRINCKKEAVAEYFDQEHTPPSIKK